ncbi:MAG TPA: arginase family protein [Candidatus Polarisedimenticolia bacterium]|nr:arginase family protein [Candidatus Polarisedimenticolia bacterium]
MKNRCATLLILGLLPLSGVLFAQIREGSASPVRVALVKMPYVGERNVPDTSRGPDYLEQGGIQKLLEAQGVQTKPVSATALTADEEKAYGSWNKLALASGDLAKLVSEDRRNGYLPIGLLANCNGILGMLSGLQHSGPSAKPLRVGMVFIDAHGDFNTPETTLSGMLGGMPVAIAAGQCLTRMRLKAGLEPALPTRHIVEMCVRDTDPLEQELLDRSDIKQLTLEDVRAHSANLQREMKRLSEATDVIYIHVDMDALDPREVSGHALTVPGGPTSLELAAALTEMFKYEKVAAFGVASTPFDDHDKGGLSRQAAYNLVLGAVKGVQQRKKE